MAPSATAASKPPVYLAWMPLILLCIVQIGTTADNAVLMNSTSALLNSFQATVSQVQIANAMFPLCASVFMIIGGFIGLMIGWKRILQIGLIVLTAGEILAVLSPTMQVFTYAARVLTGVGASLATPGMLGLIPGLYHGRKQAIAFSAIAAANGIAAAIGPIAGGAIIVSFGWRLAFLILAILFAATLCGSFVIKSVPKPEKIQRFDIVGALLLIIVMGGVFVGLLTINEWGLIHPRLAPFTLFGLPPPLFLMGLGLFTFWLFLRWQKRLEDTGANTLLPSIFMNNRQVRAGLYLILLVFATMGSFSFLIITYLQVVVGLNALHTGIAVSAYAIALAIFAMVSPLLFKHLSPRLICRVGISILILSCLMLASELRSVATNQLLLLGLFFAGAGSGLIVSQSSIVITRAIDQSNAEQSGGIQGTMRNLGMAMGVAISGVILIAALTTTVKDTTAAMPQLSTQFKSHIALLRDIQFLTNKEVTVILQKQAIAPQQLKIMLEVNETSRLFAAQVTLLALAALFFLFLFPTRHLPKYSLMENDDETESL